MSYRNSGELNHHFDRRETFCQHVVSWRLSSFFYLIGEANINMPDHSCIIL